MSTVYTKTYEPLPFCESEILRYAGVKEKLPQIVDLSREMQKEAEKQLTYKVCYGEYEIKISGDKISFGFMDVQSAALAKNLAGCDSAVIFAATVGIGLDRLITKYSTTAPSEALMLQAIGAERIESLCDAFCGDLKREKALVEQVTVNRFSPGYGDLDIAVQEEIFRVLDCSRKIGLSLCGSMLMSPTKSVTAIVGIKRGESCENSEKSCDSCDCHECCFRRE